MLASSKVITYESMKQNLGFGPVLGRFWAGFGPVLGRLAALKISSMKKNATFEGSLQVFMGKLKKKNI